MDFLVWLEQLSRPSSQAAWLKVKPYCNHYGYLKGYCKHSASGPGCEKYYCNSTPSGNMLVGILDRMGMI
eukprot:1153505-Pelagomonas_calceolata.AAC.1